MSSVSDRVKRMFNFRNCSRGSSLLSHEYRRCHSVDHNGHQDELDASDRPYLSLVNIYSPTMDGSVKEWPLYWPDTTFAEAEKVLGEQPDGTYLIRDTTSKHAFSLSVRWEDKVRHFHIKNEKGNYSFASNGLYSSSTIFEFLSKTVDESHRGQIQVRRKSPRDKKVVVRFLYPMWRRNMKSPSEK